MGNPLDATTRTTGGCMSIEQHVTSLELSQQLKELGFPQDSLFYWVKFKGDYPIHVYSSELIGPFTEYAESSVEFKVSAYTASELMEFYDIKNAHHGIKLFKSPGIIEFEFNDLRAELKIVSERPLIEILAEGLIASMHHKLMEIPE